MPISPHLSCIIRENIFHSAPPEDMVAHNDDAKKTHLALMHVHGDVLDRLDIGSLMRSFISVNPERKATFGVL